MATARARVRGLVALAAWLFGCGSAPAPALTPVKTERKEPPAPVVSCAAVSEPFSGTVCTPNDGKRHPGLLLFGSGDPGEPLSGQARELAARGRVCASVRYFGAPGTPSALVRVPLELGGAALRFLRERDDVEPSELALFGSSKGGEYALLVAAHYPEVTAVAVVGAAPFAWFGLGEDGQPMGCSWTHEERTLPCVPEEEKASLLLRSKASAGEPLSFRPLYEASRKQRDLVKAATIPVERIHGPVLCLAGDDDRYWNSRAHCELLLNRLKERGHAHADRARGYPGAGHLFVAARQGPGAALNVLERQSFRIALGGSPEADARSAREAWTELEGFLPAR